MNIEIIQPGTKAQTVLDKIHGIITCVHIDAGTVTYDFSYFHDGEYKTARLYEFEFTVENNEKKSIGYR